MMTCMKIKTSITLSEELLNTVDNMAVDYKNRSEFIELALWRAIKQMVREEQDAHDVLIINAHLDELNAEAEDVMAYQVMP